VLAQIVVFDGFDPVEVIAPFEALGAPDTATEMMRGHS
jgi:hypothetical protein